MRRYTVTFSMVLLLAACQDKPTDPPKPGVLTVTFTSPYADDRAVIVAVTGPASIDGVQAPQSSYVVHSRGSGSSFKAAVFGPLADGALLRFQVPDVKQANGYSATLVQVADADNQVRTSLGEYTLSITQ